MRHPCSFGSSLVVSYFTCTTSLRPQHVYPVPFISTIYRSITNTHGGCCVLCSYLHLSENVGQSARQPESFPLCFSFSPLHFLYHLIYSTSTSSITSQPCVCYCPFDHTYGYFLLHNLLFDPDFFGIPCMISTINYFKPPEQTTLNSTNLPCIRT